MATGMKAPRWRVAKSYSLIALSILFVAWMDPPKGVGIALIMVIGSIVTYFFYIRLWMSD
jgi:hypothetical protein